MNALPSNLPSPVNAAPAGASISDENDEGDLLLRVAGIVPAADFHPFVVRAARRLGLRGWVRHDPAGALIRAVGPESALVRLVRAVRTDAPASARVRGLDPDLITAATPPVNDRFVALVDDPVEMKPATSLAHVA